MSRSAVTVDGVSKRFRLYHERNQSLKAAVMRRRRARYDEFWALRDVSLAVPEGKTFGLIGHNGSGKSTMLKCMARILRPDEGSIAVNGKVSALLELGAGFHPELSGRDNVYLNGSILGLSKRDIDGRFDEIVDFAGLSEFIDTPVKNYSSGMYVRLGFSVAINVDPEILMVDEVLAVGDESFQRKCMEKFAEFKADGRTIVIVSHALGSLRSMCDEVAWLDHGRLVDVGRPSKLVDDYVGASHEDRTSTEGQASRWGSGELRIERMELLRDGAVTTLVRTGDPVTFRLHFKAGEPIAEPVFGLAIHTVGGQHVTGPNTRDVDLATESVHGDGFVDLHVPRLMLTAGTYDVAVSAYDHPMLHAYDFQQRALRFDVDPGDPPDRFGVVSLGGSWSIHSDRTAMKETS